MGIDGLMSDQLFIEQNSELVTDILMQKDPDRFVDRETALEYLQERGIAKPQEEESPEGSLLQELIKPV